MCLATKIRENVIFSRRHRKVSTTSAKLVFVVATWRTGRSRPRSICEAVRGRFAYKRGRHMRQENFKKNKMKRILTSPFWMYTTILCWKVKLRLFGYMTSRAVVLYKLNFTLSLYTSRVQRNIIKVPWASTMQILFNLFAHREFNFALIGTTCYK